MEQHRPANVNPRGGVEADEWESAVSPLGAWEVRQPPGLNMMG
jgi:hypothetical protein